MSIGKKLGISFYSLILLLCISVGVSVFNLNNIDNKMEEALDNRVTQMIEVEEMRYLLAMQGLYIREVIVQDSDTSLDSLLSYKTAFDEQVEALSKQVRSDTMKGYLQELDSFKKKYDEHLYLVFDALEKGDTKQASSIVTNLVTAESDNLTRVTDKMFEYQNSQLTKINEESDVAVDSAKTVSVIVLIISLIISLLLVLYVNLKITKPLRKAVAFVNEVSTGDLTEENLPVKTKDEIGQLSKAINTMKDNLKSLIQIVQQNAAHLSAAAEELSASTEEITASTEDITNRVEATAEVVKISAQATIESSQSMDETAAGVQRIAESTQVLHSSSLDASQTATQGKEIIHQAEAQMDTISRTASSLNEVVLKLSSQTEEIEKISKVITAITEQTNLLALNAAIEAARAGEHGKGFAVVADEVRKLAEESNASATQIYNLTSEIKLDTGNVEKAVLESLESVKDGVKIIGVAGESFTSIVQAVEKMKLQIEEISATSEQISASAEEVSASVNEISKGAANSANDVEMIAAAIEEQAATMEQVNNIALELTAKAESLQNEIQVFKL